MAQSLTRPRRISCSGRQMVVYSAIMNTRNLAILGFVCILWVCSGCGSKEPVGEAASSGPSQGAARPLSDDPACNWEDWHAALQVGANPDYTVRNEQLAPFRSSQCKEVRYLADRLMERTMAGSPAPIRVDHVKLDKFRPANGVIVKRRVKVDLLIGVDGRVAEVDPLEGFKGDWIDEAVLATVRDWLFIPARDEAGFAERKYPYDVFLVD